MILSYLLTLTNYFSNVSSTDEYVLWHFAFLENAKLCTRFDFKDYNQNLTNNNIDPRFISAKSNANLKTKTHSYFFLVNLSAQPCLSPSHIVFEKKNQSKPAFSTHEVLKYPRLPRILLLGIKANICLYDKATEVSSNFSKITMLIFYCF